MNVTRIDLADAGSPERLVQAILKCEPSLKAPVPIDDLCRKLDIDDIVPLSTPGFEGGLFTDRAKSRGIIGYNRQSGRRRRRFTIAHELGHFLIPTHIPGENDSFLCSVEDMCRLSVKEQGRRVRMEAEANRFAALLLMPPPFFRKDVATNSEPSLDHIFEIADKYDTSKEATARWYIQFRPEPCAIVVGKAERILRCYKNARFPFLDHNWGGPLPDTSRSVLQRLSQGDISNWLRVDAGVWLSVNFGQRAPELVQQTHAQRDEYSLTLLIIESDDEGSEYEERELQESWAVRFRK